MRKNISITSKSIIYSRINLPRNSKKKMRERETDKITTTTTYLYLANESINEIKPSRPLLQ